MLGDAMRRFVDPIIADWQFERSAARARGDRWGAHLATLRGAAALLRVLVHCVAPALQDAFASDVSRRAAWSVAAATALVTALLGTLPFLAFMVDGFPSLTLTAANVLRLTAFEMPAFVVSGIGLGLPIGVLLACRDALDGRRVRTAVAVLALAGTVAVSGLVVWVVPPATHAFRQLTEPPELGLRINLPGTIGYGFEQQQRWTAVAAVIVLSAFAITAAAAARGRRSVRLTAGVALLLYPFVYVPAFILAINRVLPVPLAAWLPNLLFTTATVLIVRLKPDIT
jgi:hypothetical protein